MNRTNRRTYSSGLWAFFVGVAVSFAICKTIVLDILFDKFIILKWFQIEIKYKIDWSMYSIDGANEVLFKFIISPNRFDVSTPNTWWFFSFLLLFYFIEFQFFFFFVFMYVSILIRYSIQSVNIHLMYLQPE